MTTTELPSGLEEVDIIVIGGGTAGSIIASRLADAKPQSTILVVEGGPDNYRIPTIVHPALYKANYRPQSNLSLAYLSAPEPQLANRSITFSMGGVLGGGSSVNGAIYARAQQVDYDSWATKGWSTEELLPFMKKLESFYAPTSSSTHGLDGPTNVSDGRHSCLPLRDDFIFAVKQNGYSSADDLQDLVSNNAVSTAHRYVSPGTGERQDSAHTYLHPRLKDENVKNLHVLVESQVIRILFDEGKRASGIEIRANPALQSGEGGSKYTVKARKLVIISAGALGTPQILERSGIGGDQVLKQAGVPVISDLPGVGHDYQDHQMILVTYNSTLTLVQSADSVINGSLNVTELLSNNDKILSWNGVDASSKLRPSQEEVAGFKPELRKVWDEHFEHSPNRPLGSIILISGVLGDPSAYPSGQQYFTMACYSTYPRSRGHVHITGPKMEDPLDFKTGLLSDPEGSDVQTLAWLYKKQRKIVAKMKMQRGPASTEPLFTDDPDEDDSAIEEWVRNNVGTAYHPMGTCKMAPRENGGVVDGKLSVYGVRGLKIADMSIAPENVSGNTMSTALLIGEKAADIFIHELGSKTA
ncbi:alcohol oxidase [Hypoxylon sp. FL1284]|nr:alcohol oxidase [Hypoxylon sp. FL1284]